MKHVIFLLTFLALLLSSCGKDNDDPSCTRDQWLGTYTGMVDCLDDDEDEMLPQVIFSAGTGENEIIVDAGDGDPTNFVINGCSIPEETQAFNLFGIDFSVTVNGELDGNNISITLVTEVNTPATDTDPATTETQICTITYTK